MVLGIDRRGRQVYGIYETTSIEAGEYYDYAGITKFCVQKGGDIVDKKGA